MAKNEDIQQTYKGIPSMTPRIVHKYLYDLGSSWTGQGIAIELGSWLGGTAFPLLEGLSVAGYDKVFYVYDRWIANNEQVIKAKEQGVKIKENQDLKPLFLDNIKSTIKIECIQGDIQRNIKDYNKGLIEVCIFDAPKINPCFEISMKSLMPYFIDGATIGLLDFNFYLKKKGKQREKLLAPVRFIDKYYKNFIKIAEWKDQCSCAFFKFRKNGNI